MSLYTLQYCEVVEALLHSFLPLFQRSSLNNALAALRLGKKLPLWVPWSSVFMQLNVRFSTRLQNIQNYFMCFRSVNDQGWLQAKIYCCCTCNHIAVILLYLHTSKLFYFRIPLFAFMCHRIYGAFFIFQELFYKNWTYIHFILCLDIMLSTIDVDSTAELKRPQHDAFH